MESHEKWSLTSISKGTIYTLHKWQSGKAAGMEEGSHISSTVELMQVVITYCRWKYKLVRTLWVKALSMYVLYHMHEFETTMTFPREVWFRELNSGGFFLSSGGKGPKWKERWDVCLSFLNELLEKKRNVEIFSLEAEERCGLLFLLLNKPIAWKQ